MDPPPEVKEETFLGAVPFRGRGARGVLAHQAQLSTQSLCDREYGRGLDAVVYSASSAEESPPLTRAMM